MYKYHHQQCQRSNMLNERSLCIEYSGGVPSQCSGLVPLCSLRAFDEGLLLGQRSVTLRTASRAAALPHVLMKYNSTADCWSKACRSHFWFWLTAAQQQCRSLHSDTRNIGQQPTAPRVMIWCAQICRVAVVELQCGASACTAHLCCVRQLGRHSSQLLQFQLKRLLSHHHQHRSDNGTRIDCSERRESSKNTLRPATTGASMRIDQPPRF